MALIFALAIKVERNQQRLSAYYVWVYGLSLGVLHTAWAFYGYVGDAAANGLRFLSIDFGLYGSLFLWFFLLRRMVLVKDALHITSLADLIAARYNHSQYIAGLVALIAFFGTVPYVGLQLKAIADSIGVITVGIGQDSGNVYAHAIGMFTSFILLIFTILYGIRRLDPTEHHYGMIFVLALECIVKLLAVVVVGAYVVWGLYEGVADLFSEAEAAGFGYVTTFRVAEMGSVALVSQFIIGFASVFILPRMFHISVVENESPKHVLPAIIILTGYIFIFFLSVVPVALAGLLQGWSLEHADMFMLLVPQQSENPLLIIMTFLGGFAAASGMVIITTTTVSTMVANHVVLPVIEADKRLSFLRSYLLQVRWAIAFFIIFFSYVFVAFLSAPFFLQTIGNLAITALLQVLPALVFGLLWRRGNEKGALWGMSAGLVMWLYTLFLPIVFRQFEIFPDFIASGPWGLEWLRPEGLLGVSGLDNMSHGIFFSTGVNVLLYWLVSVSFESYKQERTLADEFMSTFSSTPPERQIRPAGVDDYIDFSRKYDEAMKLLLNYLRRDKATQLLQHITDDLKFAGRKHINIIELVEFHRLVEHELAGSIGAVSSHSAMNSHIQYSKRESNDLKMMFHHLATELKVTDSHTMEHQDSGEVINVLQSRIAKLEHEIFEKEEALGDLRDKLEAQYEEAFRWRVKLQKGERLMEGEPHGPVIKKSFSDLEEENTQLKRMYAELSLEHEKLKKLLDKTE